MAEMKNTEKQNIGIQKEEEKEKLESVKKADAAENPCMTLQVRRFSMKN